MISYDYSTIYKNHQLLQTPKITNKTNKTHHPKTLQHNYPNIYLKHPKIKSHPLNIITQNTTINPSTSSL